MDEQTVKELTWAIRALTDEIERYRKVKERGVRLAERIEAQREEYQAGKYYVAP